MKHFVEIDNGGRLKTKLYDKRDDFTFPIINFPFISSNIPAAPAYGFLQNVSLIQVQGAELLIVIPPYI
jgi:hypothetical protein